MQHTVANKFFRKTANGDKKSNWFKTGLGITKETYEEGSKLGWLGVPISAALVTAAAIKLLKPSAVAKNADKVLHTEILRTSLNQSKKDLEAMRDKVEAVHKPRHDRFL